MSTVQEWSAGRIAGMDLIFLFFPALCIASTSEHWMVLVSRNQHNLPLLLTFHQMLGGESSQPSSSGNEIPYPG